VWNASRKPLVGQFEFNGKDVFVIANHFDAKLGDQSQDGRFQFPAQCSAVQRAGMAGRIIGCRSTLHGGYSDPRSCDLAAWKRSHVRCSGWAGWSSMPGSAPCARAQPPGTGGRIREGAAQVRDILAGQTRVPARVITRSTVAGQR
jgi:hypothetical protein